MAPPLVVPGRWDDQAVPLSRSSVRRTHRGRPTGCWPTTGSTRTWRAPAKRCAPWATATGGRAASAPGSTADGVHYPGTYLAGVYNRLSSDLGGRAVEDEHLVNAPTGPRSPSARREGPPYSARLGADAGCYRRAGPAPRRARPASAVYRDAAGRSTRVSLALAGAPQAACISRCCETTVEAEDWSGPLVVRSGIDGRVANRNVAASTGCSPTSTCSRSPPRDRPRDRAAGHGDQPVPGAHRDGGADQGRIRRRAALRSAVGCSRRPGLGRAGVRRWSCRQGSR